jgi:mitogen-activated protein kinase 1/3
MSFFQMSLSNISKHIKDIYIVTNLMESDLERIIRSKQTLTDQHFMYFMYQVRLCTYTYDL